MARLYKPDTMDYAILSSGINLAVGSIYTVVDQDQFDEEIPRLEVKVRDVDANANMFGDIVAMMRFDQLDHSKYENLTSRAVHDTFSYMFYKFKKGIFVSINDGKFIKFLAFSNAKYRNEWSHLLKTRYPSIQALIDKSSQVAGFTPKQKHLPLDQWQANDAMFRYDQEDNSNNVLVYEDFFTVLCEERDIPDIELFVNKRDYPLLKQDYTEPYENLYGTKSQTLLSHAYEKYSPILSGCISNGFADVLIPTHEDWIRARYQRDSKTLPNLYKTYPIITGNVSWTRKKNIAVFRGSSTGAGVTPATNQRLLALEISAEFPTYLDVGITKWNTRIRKHISSKYLETIERVAGGKREASRKSYPTAPYLTLQQQTDEYKYIINLEGHVASYRLSYELSSYSVILLVDSKWKLWYSRFLKPYIHYVPVKNDLSDLVDQIVWCRTHDEECKQIVANARAFYDKYLGVDGILDFTQRTLIDLSRIIGGYSWLPNLLDLALSEEKSRLLENYENTTKYRYPLSSGPRCMGRLIASDKVLQKLKFVRNVHKGADITVDCMKTNGFYVARKYYTSAKPGKMREQIHEAYIGRYAINYVLKNCPNFTYTYRLQPDDSTVTEYINGPVLSKWIASDKYNEKDLINIMCGVNLALATAQTCCAFVHYDLTTDHVMVQTLREPVAFDYHVGTKTQLRYTSVIIPIIIDYGKSRAVIYEPKYGVVDRGYRNLYQTRNISFDTLTLINSVIDKLAKVKKPIPQILSDLRTTDVTPLTFVAAASKYINLTPVKPGTYKSRMNKGNAYIEELMMKYGDKNIAVDNAIDRLYRQTIPRTNNAVIGAIFRTIIAKHIPDLDEYARGNTKYELIRSTIMKQQQPTSVTIAMNFPEPEYLAMDAYLTPTELESLVPHTTKIDGDWISIINTCVNASIDDPNLDMFGLLDGPVFDYLNDIASNNTLLWIQDSV